MLLQETKVTENTELKFAILFFTYFAYVLKSFLEIFFVDLWKCQKMTVRQETCF
jgi:hypothetical protein